MIDQTWDIVVLKNITLEKIETLNWATTDFVFSTTNVTQIMNLST